MFGLITKHTKEIGHITKCMDMVDRSGLMVVFTRDSITMTKNMGLGLLVGLMVRNILVIFKMAFSRVLDCFYWRMGNREEGSGMRVNVLGGLMKLAQIFHHRLLDY